jgi:Transcriptional regulators
MVRIKDVAKFGNVSVSSVSRFLNAPETLRPETFRKVKEAIEALHYSPSPIARSLRTKSTDTIALIIPSLKNMYYIDLYSELYDMASTAGYTVNLLSTNGDHDVLRKYLHELPIQNVDGIMVCYLDDDESMLDDFRNAQKHTPLVLITSMQNRQEFNSIFLDVEEGEMRATQHMIDMGCENLAFVGGKRIGSTIVKQRGFESVLSKNGLKISPEFYFFDRNYFATGFKAVRHFLSLDRQPDGIVCATDDIAIGCVKYLLRSGFKIPGDIKVVGHNGISLIDAIEPSISSLSHPVKDIVEEAMRLLRKQIDHPDARQQQVILYTTLVVNTSTDANAPVRLTEKK